MTCKRRKVKVSDYSLLILVHRNTRGIESDMPSVMKRNPRVPIAFNSACLAISRQHSILVNHQLLQLPAAWMETPNPSLSAGAGAEADHGKTGHNLP